MTEHLVIFTHDRDPDSFNDEGSQAPLVASCILSAYGAERLDSTEEREALAMGAGYHYDIKFETSYNLDYHEITDATAFYIGWIDKVPEVFLEEGWDETE